MITEYILLQKLIDFKHDIGLLSILFHIDSSFDKMIHFLSFLTFFQNFSSCSCILWKSLILDKMPLSVFTAEWIFIPVSANFMLQEWINLWIKMFIYFFYNFENALHKLIQTFTKELSSLSLKRRLLNWFLFFLT